MYSVMICREGETIYLVRETEDDYIMSRERARAGRFYRIKAEMLARELNELGHGPAEEFLA